MISFYTFAKRRGTTLAGVFSLALSCVLLLCGAGTVPVENLLPRGAMQGDLNAGGHSLTNAATVSATNFSLNGNSITNWPSSGSNLTLGNNSTNAAPGSGSTVYVPQTTTVNGHALTNNVTVTASDVGADASGTAAALLSASNAWSGTNNFTGAFQWHGATFTLPTLSGSVATLNNAQTFTAPQTYAAGIQSATGPSGYIVMLQGDSRFVSGWFDAPAWSNQAAGQPGEQDIQLFNESPTVNQIEGNSFCWTFASGNLGSALQDSGFGYNSFCVNYGQPGGGIQNAIYVYALGCVSIPNCTVTSGSASVTLSTTSGLSGGNMMVAGPGIYPAGMQCSTSSTSATLADQMTGGRKAFATHTGNDTLVF